MVPQHLWIDHLSGIGDRTIGNTLMADKLPEFLGALVNDAFSLALVPGGSTAGFFVTTALSNIMAKRAAVARDILLEEVRLGDVPLSAPQIEEGVAVLYRYLRAAQEGAARVNLRLLAQAIAGKASRGDLDASEFLHDANMIGSLRFAEIQLLAKLHQAWSSEWILENEESARPIAAMEWVKCELVPSVFETYGDLIATAGSVVRTGLLSVAPGLDGMTYFTTLYLERLMEDSPFDEAIAKEA
jgi:hypothetical protein